MTRPVEGEVRWHVAALAFYTCLSVGFIDHGESLTRRIAGQGSDPFAFIWFLAWWPWAIAHHINPLVTHLVWQPVGVYLAWVTSVPLLALIGLPLTLLSGPVLTFNVLILAAPVLAAWAAYFLCLRITGGITGGITKVPAAAIIGGFLFGFSSYEMGQDSATLNLSFTALVPALLWVILLRLDDAISRLRVVLLVGLMLICQFLISIEIFGLVFVFGGIAWLLAMLYLPEQRMVLRRLVIDGLLTAPLVIVILSPFLVSMLGHSASVNLPAIWPYFFTADFLNVFVPTRMNLIGGGLFKAISSKFNDGVGIQEQGAYLGLPLLVIIGFFAREKSRTPPGRFLFVMFLLLVLASLGPRLWIAGHYSGIALPWLALMHLPLVASALPIRFSMFVSLAAAVIAALWIAEEAERKQCFLKKARKNYFESGWVVWLRGCLSPWPRVKKFFCFFLFTKRRFFWRSWLGLLACVALLPVLHPWMNVPDSAFFRPGRVEAVLGRGAVVLVLPFAINGASSFWQQENQFGFVQTGGYLGYPPASMQLYPAVGALFGSVQGKGFAGDFVGFCLATKTRFVVVGPGTTAELAADIARLNWPEQAVDDVLVYTVPGIRADTVTHG
jgi:hypothetical protein